MQEEVDTLLSLVLMNEIVCSAFTSSSGVSEYWEYVYSGSNEQSFWWDRESMRKHNC